jgi:hypothetical protein
MKKAGATLLSLTCPGRKEFGIIISDTNGSGDIHNHTCDHIHDRSHDVAYLQP